MNTEKLFIIEIKEHIKEVKYDVLINGELIISTRTPIIASRYLDVIEKAYEIAKLSFKIKPWARRA